MRSLQLKGNAIIIIIITLKFADFPGSVDLHNPVPLHFREDKNEKDTPPRLAPFRAGNARPNRHYYYIPLNITTMRRFFLSSFMAGGNAAVGLSQIREVNSPPEGAFMWFPTLSLATQVSHSFRRSEMGSFLIKQLHGVAVVFLPVSSI